MMNFITIQGKRNRILFTRTAKTVVEITGISRGACLHISSAISVEKIKQFDPKNGPYIYRGMDLATVGLTGKVERFEIKSDKIILHLQQPIRDDTVDFYM